MERQADIHSLSFKLSLLAISLFIMMSAVISPALPLMMKAFPNVDRVNIELLTTIPNAGMIVGLLFSPIMIRKLHPKNVVIIGLLFVGIAGTLPVFLNNYYAIILSRIFLGVGIGIYNSLAVSLILQLYRHDQKDLNQMIGFQNIMNNLGYVVASLAICYLVTISWHAVFWVYIIALPVLLAFVVFVHLPQKSKNSQKQQISFRTAFSHTPPIVVWIGLIVLLIYIFYMAMAYKLPTLIVDSKLGTESTASLMLALIAGIGIPFSATFNWFERVFHQFVFPLCLSFNAIGFFFLSHSHHFITLLLSCIVLGSGFGLVMPFIFKWIDEVTDQLSVNLATTYTLIMMDIGCAISPLIISIIDRSARGALLSSAIFFTILTIYGFFRTLKAKKKVG